ncbi:uncharacterized protein LOC134282632 [Saccostrea cucullata]|uniref:uncharacterized protein LOC134282632 n=1 Tax=Saccostrea cuccullata TaxID=36930 RepID=UPI002ED61C53
MVCLQIRMKGFIFTVLCLGYLSFLQGCSAAYRSYRSYRSSYSYYYDSYSYYYYSSGTSEIGGIIGGSISAVIFLVTGAVFCCCFCRYQQRRRQTTGTVRYLNSGTTNTAIITTNTTPGVVYPPPYQSGPASNVPVLQPATGQTFGPQYNEPAPAYDSVFGPNGGTAPPYPSPENGLSLNADGNKESPYPTLPHNNLGSNASPPYPT